MFTGLDFFVLLAIPLFILTSEVMNRSSVSGRIFDFANSLVGSIPGGLGHVNVLTSIIFSGMSGSAVADVGGIGRLCYRAMVDEGYEKPYQRRRHRRQRGDRADHPAEHSDGRLLDGVGRFGGQAVLRRRGAGV